VNPLTGLISTYFNMSSTDESHATNVEIQMTEADNEENLLEDTNCAVNVNPNCSIEVPENNIQVERNEVYETCSEEDDCIKLAVFVLSVLLTLIQIMCLEYKLFFVN
jgi:hypothetical protein